MCLIAYYLLVVKFKIDLYNWITLEIIFNSCILMRRFLTLKDAIYNLYVVKLAYCISSPHLALLKS